ncbi:hypothetical protein [Moorella sp. Hama-1]|uniref:hypothetical protein n=1 Tax=Moorella sp. Hama-1 TaxID=2138101 RepID=UPI000D655DE4|nr:hypothetical protein [Moorella sp. Hama-1]MDN5362181.1 hypothetical protein [Moorella sp. (in: firmicutes)]BCV21370.1 hypothetical protein hamaS1_14390 [Moorella sp. Hama-1]
MDWWDKIRRVLELDQTELALWAEIAAGAPSEKLRVIIRAMMDRERDEMRTLQAILSSHGGWYPGPEGPPGYTPYSEKGQEK